MRCETCGKELNGPAVDFLSIEGDGRVAFTCCPACAAEYRREMADEGRQPLEGVAHDYTKPVIETILCAGCGREIPARQGVVRTADDGGQYRYCPACAQDMSGD
ncbi:MAG: hypothetical protein ACOYJY_01680 [Acutalibacteraceae bacterium]|jgi:hypothetical protein